MRHYMLCLTVQASKRYKYSFSHNYQNLKHVTVDLYILMLCHMLNVCTARNEFEHRGLGRIDLCTRKFVKLLQVFLAKFQNSKPFLKLD